MSSRESWFSIHVNLNAMLKKVSLWLSEATSPCHVQKAAEDLPLPIFFCFALKVKGHFFAYKTSNKTRIIGSSSGWSIATVGSKRLPEFRSRREKVVGSFHRFHRFHRFFRPSAMGSSCHFGSSTALCFLTQHLAQKSWPWIQNRSCFFRWKHAKLIKLIKVRSTVSWEEFFWTKKASWTFH